MKSFIFFPFSSIARARGVRALSLTSASAVNVTVCGANGGIGQPLTLLLKASPLITQLSLYDIVNVPGVAADLSHIATPAKVKAYQGPEQLEDAVRGMDIVLISAGVPRKPGMTRDDLFATNASIVYQLVTGVACAAPKALIALITNPINMTVPVAAEVLKKAGAFDPKRLFGLTTLDIVRAQTFYAETTGINPCKVKIPVVGGHAGSTIIPLFSQSCPPCSLPPDQIQALTVRLQEAGTEVVKAKAGAGSATLSMAYAAAMFTNSLCRAIQGEKNVVECAYVQSDITEATYFANPLLLGPQGVQTNLGYGKVNEYEKKQIQEAIPTLKKNIKMGEDFVLNMK